MIHATETFRPDAPVATEEVIDLNVRPKTDRINISGDTVTESTAGLPDKQQYLIRWLHSYAMQEEWGWAETAKQSTIGSTTLYRVWHGRYEVDGKPVGLESVCEKIERCKSLCEQRAAMRRLPFVETSIWGKINKVCDESRLMQVISLVYGMPQIGKTECAQEYARRNDTGRTVYVRVPACAGVQLLMKHLARAVHVSPKSSFENLKERVFKAFDHTKLLLIDECHLFFETYQKGSVLRCLETLRELHDLRGCGVVLFGTEVFKEELKTGEYSKMLRQLVRRGIYELQLPDVAPRRDLWAVAAAYHLPEPKGEAEELVLLIAKQHGLGRYIKLLSKSSQMAAKSGKRVSWEHFIRAHDLIAKMSFCEEESR